MPTATLTSHWTAFEVELRRDHLEHGLAQSCKWCAVALAVSEAIGSWRFVDVAVDGRIIVKDEAGRHVEAGVDEPARIAAIVRAVDSGLARTIAPTTFRIWCPFPALEEL